MVGMSSAAGRGRPSDPRGSAVGEDDGGEDDGGGEDGEEEGDEEDGEGEEPETDEEGDDDGDDDAHPPTSSSAAVATGTHLTSSPYG